VSDIILIFIRMGKTIQIISLLVTDGSKPNLVVAYVRFNLGRSPHHTKLF